MPCSGGPRAMRNPSFLRFLLSGILSQQQGRDDALGRLSAKKWKLDLTVYPWYWKQYFSQLIHNTMQCTEKVGFWRNSTICKHMAPLGHLFSWASLFLVGSPDWLNVCCWHGQGHVKDPSLRSTSPTSPQLRKMAKPSGGVWVWILIISVENAHQ